MMKGCARLYRPLSERTMNMSRFGRLDSCAAAVVLVPAGVSAQTELGPKVEKTYGEGLPRDSSRSDLRRLAVSRLAADP